MLQVLQYSHILESESGADSGPAQVPGETVTVTELGLS